MNDKLVFLLLIVLIILIILILLLFYSQHKLKQEMQANEINYHTYLDNINNNLIVFQDMVNKNLNNLSNTTFERFSHMENRVFDGINRGLDVTNNSFVKVMNSLGRIDEAQTNIKTLATDINELQRIFNDKKSRGIYGEIELESLLNKLFGNNRELYELQYKLSNGNIVDCVLKAQEPLNLICIDAKFPLENYNRIFNTNNSNDKVTAINLFKRNIIKHINDIHDKYLSVEEVYTLGFMFIPAEAIFSYIYGQFSDIVDYAYQKHVIIVSPTTLMSYITAIKALHLKQKRDDNVLLIQKHYRKLGVEVERFNTRYQSLLKDFDKIQGDMNNLSITIEKLLKQFDTINRVELEGDLDEIY